MTPAEAVEVARLRVVTDRWERQAQDARRAHETATRPYVLREVELTPFGERACPNHRRPNIAAPGGLCLRCIVELDQALMGLGEITGRLRANSGQLGTSGQLAYIGPRSKGGPPIPLDLATDTLVSEIEHTMLTWAEVVGEAKGAPARDWILLATHRPVLLGQGATAVWRWSDAQADWEAIDMDGAQAGALFISLYRRGLRRLGQDRGGDPLAAPCPECELAALIMRPGAGVECDACTFVCSRDDYARWQTFVAAYASTIRQGESA